MLNVLIGIRDDFFLYNGDNGTGENVVDDAGVADDNIEVDCGISDDYFYGDDDECEQGKGFDIVIETILKRFVCC